MGCDPRAFDAHKTQWTAALLGVVVLGTMAVFCGGGFELRVATASGHEAILEGRYADAAREFAAVADRHRMHASFRAHALVHYAVAQLYDGHHEHAIGALLEAEQLGATYGAIRRTTAPLLVRCFALTGDLPRARAWLEATHARLPPGAAPNAASVRWQLTGLLLCRHGQYAEARKHFQGGKQFVGRLLELDRSECALLFAFATTVVEGKADLVLDVLEGLRARRRRLDWMTKHWPELAMFAATHGFEVGPTDQPAHPHLMN
jgi:hypothetical protein